MYVTVFGNIAYVLLFSLQRCLLNECIYSVRDEETFHSKLMHICGTASYTIYRTAFRCPFCAGDSIKAHQNAYVCPHLHRTAS